METADLNSHGHYIGSIIIGVVFIIGLLIIIDELINMSRFCYRYTYLYNYGKANETNCNETKLEFERARFKIYNELSNYKFNKDIFNKSWINYVYYITVFILSILLCIAFGYLFHNFFIEGNQSCNPDPNDISNWSFLKVVMKCFCGSCHEYIPNCLVNYILLFIIILIYPLIYTLKLTAKMDFTTNSNGTMSKLFHLCVFIMLIYYIMIIYVEKSGLPTYDKYMKILIYVIYISIFYANNYLFNKTFDDYNSYKISSNNNSDKTFFDVYKQEEPIKPAVVPEPPQLKTFKYCSTSDFTNSKNKYCYGINKNSSYPDVNTNNDFYKCLILNPDFKSKIEGKLQIGDYYNADKIIIDEYYKRLKQYETDMKIYNFKYNTYMNNKSEFPEIVYFLYHMCPKLLGLHKKEIQLFFILIVILIFITYYLKTIDNRYADYLYYTALMYVIGLLSISILVTAVLNYNTYVNKYLIYEPTHNYKNLMNNKNTIFNIIMTKDNNLKELFKIYTDKYNEKINTVNLIERPSKFAKNGTLESFVKKVRDGNLNTSDNTNNPTAISDNNLLNLQMKFYKTIYSSMLNTEEIANNYSLLTITNRYLSTGDKNYQKFNDYKIGTSALNYIDSTTTSTQGNEKYINQEYVYFLLLIKKVFSTTDTNIKTKLKQIRLNFDYFIYNTDNFSDDTKIDFISFLDNRNYTENRVTRDSNTEISKHYDYNKDYIDRAFDVYAEFLKEFRVTIVDLLTTTGVSCQYTDYIDINDKMNDYYKKIFSNVGVTDNVNKYVFKTNVNEPKIDIYIKVLKIAMEKINELMIKYMNIIKVYMKSFELFPSSYITSRDATVAAENKIKVMIGKLKTNFNLFNKEFKRHTDDSFLKIPFRIDDNYKRSKYERFSTADIKKLNISTENVSWSFIILIIIFAIILIEPTII